MPKRRACGVHACAAHSVLTMASHKGMTTMRIELALKRRDEACMSVRSILSTAKVFGTPHAQILEQLKDMRKVKFAGAPSWVEHYVQGYEKALFDALYETSLVFGGYYKGVWYSTNSNRADYYGKHGIEASDYADYGSVTQRGHYWIMSDGSVKPFYITGMDRP